MTDSRLFPVEPWAVRTQRFDGSALDKTESIFALSNGHIGVRGTFDEGEPRVIPGTYLNGFFEERPLPHAESGYGFPQSGQTVVNVTEGKIIRLLVEDSPFDLRYGDILAHERVLDLRAGLLRRTTRWRSPAGQAVRVSSARLVSFTRRAIMAIEYEVEALDTDTYITLQSDLLANEPIGHDTSDPRATAVLGTPLQGDLVDAREMRAVLVHHTKNSGLRVACGADHVLEAPERVRTTVEGSTDLARLTIAARLPAGATLRLVKFVAYGWSSRRSSAALRDQAEGAVASAKLTGWEELADEQRSFLDKYWAGADVEVDGAPDLQQAVRVGTFHVLQAGVRAEGRSIPAKGLTGPGYDGHTFWDTETYVLPVLTYVAPAAARDALRWRYSILDKARDRARVLGQRGAAFPWRTIHGEECSGYWPAGTAAFHIGADIADATVRYIAATDDREFERDYGTELLVETARLWMSLGHVDSTEGFRIDGVTGPDEYTAIVDDNVYTNLMAQRNLREAAAAAARWPEVAKRLDVTEPELADWQRAADAVVVPYCAVNDVHAQAEDFTEHDEWDFDTTPPENYPLLLNYPYFEIYRKQVVKQADLVLAMHLRGDAFTAAQKAANFAYYEARTVRDSSLSASVQAIIAAEVGHLDLAYDYWGEAAFGDLQDLHGNVHHGLHLASMAGGWTVAVAGFGGMRDHNGRLTFAPRLPRALTRLRFRLTFLGHHLLVDVGQTAATYQIFDGQGSLPTSHHGEDIVVTPEPLTMPIPPAPVPPPVTQPTHREPRWRHQRPG